MGDEVVRMGEEVDTTYCVWTLVAFVLYLFSFSYVSPRLSEYCFPAYKTISRAKQLEWNSNTNSTVNAILVSVICLYVLIFQDDVSKNPVWADSPIVRSNCAMMVGYLLQDTVLQLFYYKQIGEINYVLHHCASMYAFYYVTVYGVLPWFANFRLIAEFSTPLVNQRWFLYNLGYQKDSELYVMNGLAMCAMFFMVRIISIPPYWYKVWLIYGTEAAHRLGFLWYILISTCLLLDILNVIWFKRMVVGARRVLAARSQDRLVKQKAT